MRNLGMGIVVLLASLGVEACAFRHGPTGREAESPQRSPEVPKDRWESNAPFASLIVRSSPRGAVVEVLSEDGEWVVVGTTPIESGLRMEATGRPYLVRLSKPGYFQEVMDVALLPNTRQSQVIDLELRKDELATPEARWRLEHPKSTERREKANRD